MRYIQLGTYNYYNQESEQILLFGFDPTGTFVHQLIKDETITTDTKLAEAVELTNSATTEYASEANFDIAFGEPQSIYIDGQEYILCRQHMTLDDGRVSEQANIYFFEPEHGFLMMTQFGCVPMEDEKWQQNKDSIPSYVDKAAKRILSNMALPEKLSMPIPAYEMK